MRSVVTAVPRGSDFLALTAADAPKRQLISWLVDRVRSAVQAGQLPAGSALPASRVLATDLGVSRGAVVEAYRRLADEGLVIARTGVGTIVAGPAIRDTPSAATPPASSPVPTAQPAAGTGDQITLPRPVSTGSAGTFADLSPGVPDLSVFPRTAWLRAERAVLTHASAADLGYGDPRGSRALREPLAGWLARTRGIRAGADDILIVSGVAQALALLAQTLVRRGHRSIAVEDPGSRGAHHELAHWGLTPIPITVDQGGIVVDQLVASDVEAVLVTPAHQFPTGVVLEAQRRRALLEWGRSGRLVIEDDYDAEHRYDRAPVPALQSSAPDAVAHAGSTSKTLAPGLRLGWLVAPPALRADLVAAKHASDLGSPALPQLVLAHLLTHGDYERHLRQVRRRQRARRDALLAAIREHLPEADVGGIAGGLHLLMTLPELDGVVEDTVLADELRGAGIVAQPLSWHRHRPGPPGLVLGYAAHPPDRLQAAGRRLGRVVAAHQERRRTGAAASAQRVGRAAARPGGTA